MAMYLKVITVLLSTIFFSSCGTNNITTQPESGENVEVLNYDPEEVYDPATLQVKDGVVYTTEMAANNGGIRMTSGNVEITKLSEQIKQENVERFFIRGDNVFFHNCDGSDWLRVSIYSCDMNGENLIELSDKGTNYAGFYAYGDYLYYVGFSDEADLYDEGYEDGGIFRINLNDYTEEKIIFEENISGMSIYKDRIFYRCEDNYNTVIYSTDLDGSNKTTYDDEDLPVEGLVFESENNTIVMTNYESGKEAELVIEEVLADGDMRWVVWYDTEYVYYVDVKRELKDDINGYSAYVHRMTYDKTLVE